MFPNVVDLDGVALSSKMISCPGFPGLADFLDCGAFGTKIDTIHSKPVELDTVMKGFKMIVLKREENKLINE